MLKFIKSFFAKKQETAPEVPYKVETPPAPVVSTVSEQATQAVVESITPAAPAPKKPAAKKQGAPKKTGSSKPRKPKAPKASS